MNLNDKLLCEKKRLFDIRLEEYRIKQSIQKCKNEIDRTFIFDTVLIGTVLADLITQVTGKNYIYDSCVANHFINPHDLESNVSNVEIKRNYVMNTGVSMIKPTGKIHPPFIATGNFILLSEYDLAIASEENRFCNVKSLLNTHVAREFNFVKNFLNELIEYRQEFGLVSIQDEQVKEFFDNFINNRLSELKKQYKDDNLEYLFTKKD